MLLLNASRIVTMDRLLEAVYGEDLPPTARSQVQISISSLRRLFASRSPEAIISTRANGYVIQPVSGSLDAQQFGELVAAARAAREANHLDRAVASYRDALRLWHGPALDGIDSQLIRVAASRLDEQRIATYEDRVSLELELGRHHELVGELTELVGEFPLREQLGSQLMLSLYRCGRTAEALQVYRRARRTMIEELGIEPSERLRHLERAILACDPALDPPAGPVQVHPAKKQVPGLLPTDFADFTGRTEHIGQIYQKLIPAVGGQEQLAVPVVVIVGKGGVGKTSLAVHASHGLADRFPDGQLFADLHGGSSRPVSPMQVLERFLRALGAPGSYVPEGLDERAEVYRNLLADRKVLVVLDDAASESQVMPLLPGTGAAAVIVTSRRRLAGLAGIAHVEVDVFDADKSVDLLARIAGAARVQSQRQAAAAVAEHCGHLPLALRIAGARLSARPHWSIQQLVERLADETRRLDELRHGNMGVRSSISLTYESVSEPARRLFRRLALLDLPYFSSWLSAALLDVPLAQGEDLLDDLVNAQLIETTGGGSGVHSQYRFHDLLRVFARERLAAEEPAAERKAALERALGALLYLAEQAHRRHYGGDYVELRGDALRWPLPRRLADELVCDPLAWYDRERAVLVAGVRQAAQMGFTELCWNLAARAVTLFESRIYLDDWQETHQIALDAARKAHHIRGQAAMLYSIGSLHIAQQRFGQARQVLAEAAQLFASVGDDEGLALVARYTAFLDRLNGRLDDATVGYERALAIFTRTGDAIAAAYVMHGLAQVKLELGDVGAAKRLLSDALRLTRTARCGRVEAQVLHRIGEADLLARDLPGAAGAFEQALVITRDLGDPIGEAYALVGAGVAKVRQGKFDEADEALQRAADLAAAVGQPLTQARALLGLSELALRSGDPGRAVVVGQQASEVFRSMGAPLDGTRALTLLSDAHAALGDSDAARAASAEAAALSRPPAADEPVPALGAGQSCPVTAVLA
ncbi:MAG TPA: BTAD domain-containing putative transcriptional regulator [Streptosporangiaceae bacterium]|jgi:DNA-binding SARP family transcriptional activator